MPHRFTLVLPDGMLERMFHLPWYIRRSGWQQIPEPEEGRSSYRFMTEAERLEVFFEDGGVLPVKECPYAPAHS